MEYSSELNESGFEDAFVPAKASPLRKRKRSIQDMLSSTQIADNFRDLSVTSAPSTPYKQIQPFHPSTLPSPIQESRSMLYQRIRDRPARRNFHSTLQTRCINRETQQKLVQVVENPIVMDIIFRKCSDGDLFRLYKVSDGFRRAILLNRAANTRRVSYEQVHRINKENYVITPPNSPQKCDSPPRTDSTKLNNFMRVGTTLSQKQCLKKCRSCGCAAMVDNELCQCTSTTCGIIYCLRCNSWSEKGPEHFFDKCGNSELQPLANLSNSNVSMTDSGYLSGSTPLRPQQFVKRTLFPSGERGAGALGLSNGRESVETPKRRRSVVPVRVVPGKSRVVVVNGAESPSPVKVYAGSKQSKRNLRRLTR